MASRDKTPTAIEDHYADFFGAIADMAPRLVHLHYGLCDAVAPTPWSGLRALARGPGALLKAVFQAGEVERLPSPGRALDLGCGLGGTSLELARRFGLDIVAFDRTRSQVRRAHQRLGQDPAGGRVRFAQGTGLALPFAARSFGLAVTIEVVFHVADKRTLFHELARVVAPGGRWLVVDQENRDPTNRITELFHFAEPGEIDEHAREAGFTTVREVDLSAGVARWMKTYASMASPAWQAALVPLALARGGPSLARRYLRGIRTYERLVLENARRTGMAGENARERGAIRELRLHTQRCLEDGRVAYKVWVLERG